MKKIVLVSGNFNVIHPGHLRLLKFAKECGNWLVVAVSSDRNSGSGSIVPEELRLDGVRAHSLVDEAFIWDKPIERLIEKIKPDIIVKGKEHEGKVNPELGSLQKYGGRLIFSSGETVFSSVDLLRSEFLARELTSIKHPKDFIERHSLNIDELCNTIMNFSKIQVCVLGDLIVDEYITCDALGMSQEDPTIVVTPVDSCRFLGGAGIVAAHAAGLGAKVSFATVSGNDEGYFYAKSKLSDYKVDAKFILDETRPTTLKQRFRSKGKTLLRVSHLHQDSISVELQEQFFEQVKKLLVNCNLLIFSDFNYGCLPQSLVKRIIIEARAHNIMMVADSQSSSQMGDISRYSGMDLIASTEREARISTRNNEDGLAILVEKIRAQTMSKNLILKLGEEGAIIHTHSPNNESAWQTDKIEALNGLPQDPAGAGDAMLTTASLSLACGANIWLSAYLASVSAAIQVSRMGNVPITSNDLLGELKK